MAQCPNCHSEVKPDERFCGSCGARLEPQAQPTPAAPAARPEPMRPPVTGKETIVLPPLDEPDRPANQPAAPPAEPIQPPSDATLIAGPPAQPRVLPTTPAPPLAAGYAGATLPPAVALPPQEQKSGGGRVWKILAIVAGIGVLACIALAAGVYLVAQRVSSSSELVFATVNAGLATVVAEPTIGPRPTSAPPAVSANATGDVLLEETFDSASASSFGDTESANASYAFVDGTYAITVKKPNMIVWKAVKGDFSDAAISVDALFEAGKQSAAGLLFHYQDDKNFYIFTVTQDGRYGLDVYKDDQLTTLIDWTESSAIKGAGETNAMRVETVGDKIRLYDNDELLDEVSDATLTSGRAAIAVNTFDDTGVTVRFDNLLVRGMKQT